MDSLNYASDMSGALRFHLRHTRLAVVLVNKTNSVESSVLLAAIVRYVYGCY